MPTHAEKRTLPFTPEQMFDLVAAVDRYPEFLPWCIGARVTRRSDKVVEADMIIGFRMIRERFSSRVELDRPRRIDVSYLQGPFKYLNNHWLFLRNEDGSCTIDFFVDFEFHNPLLNKLISALFNEAVQRMVSAFEARAHAMYEPIR